MTIDIESLLAPVSDASPCGDDLMFSGAFDEIQEARRADDRSLDQGEWITQRKEADWRLVGDRCTQLLRAHSKDVRLAGWLTEALAHREGIAGLAQGIALTGALCGRYWAQLHPLPDDDDGLEYRLSPLEWLIGRTRDLLNELPLTDSAGGAGGAFSALDWRRANRREKEAEPESDQVSIERIDAARAATPVAFYEASLEGFQALDTALDAFEASLRQHAGAAAPSFAAVRDALKEVAGLAERFARERGVPMLREAREASPDSSDAPAPPVAIAYGAPSGRAQAIAQLRGIAEFFRRTEPHSPVAWLADKAVRWADMPLDQWLASVVKDEGSLAHLREMLGMTPGPDA